MSNVSGLYELFVPARCHLPTTAVAYLLLVLLLMYCCKLVSDCDKISAAPFTPVLYPYLPVSMHALVGEQTGLDQKLLNTNPLFIIASI